MKRVRTAAVAAIAGLASIPMLAPPAHAYVATARNTVTICTSGNLVVATGDNGSGRRHAIKPGQKFSSDIDSVWIYTNGIGFVNFNSSGGKRMALDGGRWYDTNKKNWTRTFDVELERVGACV